LVDNRRQQRDKEGAFVAARSLREIGNLDVEVRVIPAYCIGKRECLECLSNVHEPPLELRPRDLQVQNNCPALIEADQVERILADIDADRGDGGWH
jgi:hypothetical protein